MPQVFLIGDTHFGHRKIIEFEATKALRPFSSIEEHDEELIKRWNSVVRKDDTVWHLGDVAFGIDAFNNAVSRLNGIKKLVLGNHDAFTSQIYLQYFTKLYGAVYFKENTLLTHVPVSTHQFRRWRANIHGHMHTDVIDDPRYLNVSAEQINLTPIAWEELKKRMPEAQHVKK